MHRLFLNNVMSASDEIMMMIIPQINTTTTLLNGRKTRLIKLLLEAAQKRNVKVRILVTVHTSIDTILKKINGKQNIDIKFIEPPSTKEAVRERAKETTTKSSILLLIVDRATAIVIEANETQNASSSSYSSSTPRSASISDTTIESYALCTSKADVLSHVTAFETLWKQSEGYEKIKDHGKMQEEFLNVAAHELRTPIQPIIFMADMLSSKIEDPEQRELLDVISRNAKKLQQLADDILDVTRIESNSLTLNKERFNLNDLVYDIVQDCKNNIIKEEGREERKEVEDVYSRKLLLAQPDNDDIFIVDADKSRLAQVISNLISNSLKFTSKGAITVSLHDKRIDGKGEDNIQQVEVRVTDSGTGIDPEILPRLFTKFASRSYKGTGLGLFISKSIVEAHGGRIWAKNNSDGKKGCTFYLVLPIIKEQNLRSNIKTISKKNKIFLVDNDISFTSKLKFVLEDKNQYGVDTYNDPLIALDNFISGYYDVAILDIDLPKMSGFDLCQQIRQRDRKVKVCFLTEGGGTHYKAFRELYGISDTEQFLSKKELEKGNFSVLLK
jgi:two-component system sensor histidine kinase VicK